MAQFTNCAVKIQCTILCITVVINTFLHTKVKHLEKLLLLKHLERLLNKALTAPYLVNLSKIEQDKMPILNMEDNVFIYVQNSNTTV